LAKCFATLYHNLGIDVSKVTIPDLSAVRNTLSRRCQPMPELVSEFRMKDQFKKPGHSTF